MFITFDIYFILIPPSQIESSNCVFCHKLRVARQETKTNYSIEASKSKYLERAMKFVEKLNNNFNGAKCVL